jgi:transcriptional regulator with XRE-family HTH domain
MSIISASQMRAARAALRWSIAELAEKSGVGARTIKRLEAFEGIPQGRASTMLALKIALEAAGVEFTWAARGQLGIRFPSEIEPSD